MPRSAMNLSRPLKHRKEKHRMKPETANNRSRPNPACQFTNFSKEYREIKKSLSVIDGVTVKSLRSLDWISNNPKLRWQNSKQKKSS